MESEPKSALRSKTMWEAAIRILVGLIGVYDPSLAETFLPKEMHGPIAEALVQIFGAMSTAGGVLSWALRAKTTQPLKNPFRGEMR